MSVAINSSPAGAIGNQGRWKRKASDDEDERRGDAIKKGRYSWYFTLESESPTPTDEDDESIYSVQAYETEFARDTSDTSTHSWISSNESDVSVHVEYELDSRSENENPFSELSSCSEPENILAVEFITFCDTEGLADDSDDSRSSIDSEIKKADFWTCVQCKNPNNNPMFRYCEKCYQVRKTHFPRSRPRRKARTLQKSSQGSTTGSVKLTTAMSSVASAVSSDGRELSEMDSGIASSQCELDSGIASSQDLDKPANDSQSSDAPLFDSQSSEALLSSSESQCCGDVVTTMTTTKTKTTTTTRILVAAKGPGRDDEGVESASTPKETDDDSFSSDSGDNRHTKDDAASGESQQLEGGSLDSSPSPMAILTQRLQQSRRDKSSDGGEHPETEGANGRCLICTVGPKNSAFVHGKTLHICCCYRCAVKVWMTNGHRCPICNRKVSQVSKAFYA